MYIVRTSITDGAERHSTAVVSKQPDLYKSQGIAILINLRGSQSKSFLWVVGISRIGIAFAKI